jgi:hypothetical protein
MAEAGRVILCMKWGTLYGPDYVNVLHNACRKAMAEPFRFVCLTDDATGLAEGVESYPLPDIGLAPQHWRGGGWPKFAVFKRDLYGLTGRALFIDLDTVVLRDLGAFFERPEPFVAIGTGPNWRPNREAVELQVGTGIFAFTLGEQQYLLDGLCANLDGMVATHGYEQDAVRALARSMAFWPADWVISFKRHLRRPIGLDLVLEPRRPPATAKIVAFHGTPRPLDLVRPGWWGKAPHVGRGEVSWMVSYWRDNGGSVRS